MNAQATTKAGSDVHRIKILATRVTSTEMQAIEAAAASGGATRSEWLRASALAYLQRLNNTPPTVIEPMILEEILALRLLTLNLFAAATPGLALQTVHQIMVHADSSKHLEATRVVSRAGGNQTSK